MKLQRTSIALLLAAVFFGGIVAIVETQKKPEKPGNGADQSVSQKVFDFAENQISLITIDLPKPGIAAATPTPNPTPNPTPSLTPNSTPSPSATPTIVHAIALARTNGKWEISAPIKSPANAANVAFLTNLLTTGTRDRTITVPRDRLAEFGLDQPAGSVEITLNNESKQQKHRLILGKLSFDRSLLYAQIDGDPNAAVISVSLISPQFLNAVTRSRAEWQAASAASPTPSPTPSPTASPSPTPQP
jgi:Domain of unknown function (DUF4340)